MTHEVMVLCSCDDIDFCIVARYIADVRALWLEVERLRAVKRTIEGNTVA